MGNLCLYLLVHDEIRWPEVSKENQSVHNIQQSDQRLRCLFFRGAHLFTRYLFSKQFYIDDIIIIIVNYTSWFKYQLVIGWMVNI